MAIPKVGIVIVNYNQGRYLRAAVDSVLDQDYRNFEIVLVDDGSGDGSDEIIRELSARHPEKLRAHHHPGRQNLGICRTYALGISQVRNPYIAFLEADDRWEQNYLGPKIALLDAHPEAGVAFSRYKIISDGFYGCDMALRQRILGLSVPRSTPFDNFERLMKKNNIATFSAFVVRRPLLDEISLDLPPDPDMLYYDWWILFQLALRSKFVLDGSSFIHWRLSRSSTLGRQTLARHTSMLCRFMGEMYAEIGRQDRQMSRKNRAAYLRYRSALPAFTSFYQHPGPQRFLALLRLNPVWAMDSLVSCWINRWKYSR